MIRVVTRGRAGVVILRDARDDGSYVLLECEEFEPSGGGGILGEPVDETEEFPMLRIVLARTELHAERTDREPFRLEVDISAMPPGELRFRTREFIEQAVEQSERERVEITPATAKDWGYVDEADAL